MAQKNNNEISAMHAFYAYKLIKPEADDSEIIKKVSEIKEDNDGKFEIFGTEFNVDKGGFEDFKNGALGLNSEMLKSKKVYNDGKDASEILTVAGYTIVEKLY